MRRQPRRRRPRLPDARPRATARRDAVIRASAAEPPMRSQVQAFSTSTAVLGRSLHRGRPISNGGGCHVCALAALTSDGRSHARRWKGAAAGAPADMGQRNSAALITTRPQELETCCCCCICGR
eukprot:365214-Chlamydomonas_euryale.AAC.19